jgi:hypothetical protein
MRGRERLRRFLRRAQWLILPLLVLGLADAFVRHAVDRVPSWYGAADRLASTRPVQAVFVGSSRVQAAILPSAFERVLAERGRPGTTALNLGRGYSTDAEHYLGLRNLLAAHPDRLRGVTVFAEAPGGLPWLTRWDNTPWAMAAQPWMLVDLLQPADLPRFWLESGLDLETRVHLSLRVALRWLSLFNRRERVREQFFDNLLPTLSRGKIPNFVIARTLGGDLQGPGEVTSIRHDPAALEVARKLARDMGERLGRNQAPIRDWRGTLPEALARLAQSAGGGLVFFEPPLSEAFLQGYRTKVRQEDAALFALQAREWGACVVRPAFTYSDDDLPDLWHLRPERVAEFTRAVAVAWIETCAAPR